MNLGGWEHLKQQHPRNANTYHVIQAVYAASLEACLVLPSCQPLCEVKPKNYFPAIW